MGQRYALQVSAIVVVAAGLFGCDSNPNTNGLNVPVGAGGAQPPGPTGGTTAGGAGMTPPAGAAGMSMGTAGTTPPVVTPVAGAGTAGTAPSGGMGGDMAGGGGTGMMGGEGGGAAPGAGSCGPETTVTAENLGNVMMRGPWTPTHEEGTGPNGSSWVYYPEGLGEGGLKHPVFQWGPGAGTGPSNYLDHLNLLASQGFVIISQPSTQSGREALDWILEENETMGSMWYQKLDPDRVARGGHSMGALQSFSEADDPRLKLAVLVCGGAGGGSGAGDMSYPTIFLGGEGEGGTTNFRGDYAEVTGLSVFVTKTSTDHIACARNNLAPWVAFMRWQLCGEERWKAEFEPDGTYCKSPWLACMTKNFM